MNNNHVVEILNKLVEINNDRIEGYETASKETHEQELKNLFSHLAHTSYCFKQELTKEIRSLGGTPRDDTKISDNFFRIWKDVKAALACNDRKTILCSCEYGEERAIETYESVQKDDIANLSFEHQSMIRAQYLLIKADRHKVKSMSEIFV